MRRPLLVAAVFFVHQLQHVKKITIFAIANIQQT